MASRCNSELCAILLNLVIQCVLFFLSSIFRRSVQSRADGKYSGDLAGWQRARLQPHSFLNFFYFLKCSLILSQVDFNSSKYWLAKWDKEHNHCKMGIIQKKKFRHKTFFYKRAKSSRKEGRKLFRYRIYGKSKTDWKLCLLEVGKMDEWDLGVKIRAT